MKHILIATVAVPLVTAIALAAVISVHGDDLKYTVLNEVNKNTGVRTHIYGKTEFTFLRHFPHIALEIHNVEISSPDDSVDLPFIRADKVYLLANLLDVIRGRYEINTAALENAEVVMQRNRNGKTNYLFGNRDNPASANTSFALNITTAVLKNIRFTLLDEIARVNIRLHIDDAQITGSFRNESIVLQATVNAFSHALVIQDVDYAHDKQISLQGALSVLTHKNAYELNIAQFLAEGTPFEIHGSFVLEQGDPIFDLSIRGKDIALQDVPGLLPQAWSQKFYGIKGTGKLTFNALIKGKLSSNSTPLITATASVRNATVTVPGMSNKVSALTFQATYTNGKHHSLASSQLEITNLSVQTKHGTLHGILTLSNFRNPHLHFKASGVADLSVLNQFISGNGRLKNISGILDFQNVSYRGKTSDIAAMKLNGMQGIIGLKEVEMHMDSGRFSIHEGRVSSFNKTLTLENLKVSLPGSSMEVSGKVYHMPGLYPASDEVPEVNLTVKAEQTDVKKMLNFLKKSETPSEQSTRRAKNSAPPQALAMSGLVRVNSRYIVFDKFKAYDASFTLQLNKNVLKVDDFSCNTMDGMLDLQTTIEITGNKILSNTSAQGTDINITELFAQLNNFGQSTLTAQNIAGSLTFRATVKAEFLNGQLQENTLAARSDIVIKNGQLIQFKPMEQLARYVDIQELKNIRFSTLRNTITIENRTIRIPEMYVSSSALNLALSGQQTFDHKIHYNIRLNVYDVLGKRFKKSQSINDYEEVNDNNFNLYIAMTGTISEPVISIDKRKLIRKTLFQKDNPEATIYNAPPVTEEPVPSQKSPTSGISIFDKRQKESSAQKKINTGQQEPEYIDWGDIP